ncbi:MAG: SurA N-terminal domain-containing protein [Acidobacteriia bacterium]|nr:SurA N-terminal domain-containing protein [Terriglobia bacterium]
MAKRFAIFIFGALLVLAGRPARAGDVIDRIVATVNRHIILQSDWEDALCFEAFTAGKPVEQLSPGDRKAALDRLIDQELLREQIQAADFPHASAEEVSKRVEEVRKQYPGSETEPGWQRTLARYRLTESELKGRLALQLDLLRLVDARLRPTVQIDSSSIESYYQQELLPQLRQAGAKEVPLAEVTPKIKELLTQQKMNQLLTAWLQNLRAGSEIRTDAGSSSPGGQAQ